MLRLTGFTAELDMCGTTMKAQYADGALTITGITYDSAEHLLGVLIASEKPSGAVARSEPAVEEAARKNAAPAVVASSPVALPEEDKLVIAPLTQPLVPPEIKAGTGPAPTAVVVRTADEALVSDLSKMQHLRDVISTLMGRGIVEEAAIVAECERLKDRVPIIKVVKDLTDRVHRTMSYLVSGN